MAPTPREVARRIGEEYMDFLVIPPESHESTHDVMPYETVRDAFRVMSERNRELFENIPVEVIFQENDPYNSYQDMTETVAREGILRVFSGGDPHPILSHRDEIIGRAVHDWYGHLQLEVPFTPTGEYLKWEHARDHYPAFCDRILFTEVVGQLGAAVYLDDGFADDRFEQKTFPAPAQWIEEMSQAVQEAEQ